MTTQNDPHNEEIVNLRNQVNALTARLSELEQSTLLITRVFHPALGLMCGFGLAAGLALASFYLFEGQQLMHFLSYNVPIAVPFVGFLFDRAPTYLGKPGNRASVIVLDMGLVMVALWRAVYPVPLISGHALFLTYALLTTRSLWVKIPTIVVLAEVAYFKIFLWHDPTLFGGALVAVLAALAWWMLTRPKAVSTQRRSKTELEQGEHPPSTAL